MSEEISVESVCKFITKHGGKVKNTVLVSHFKKSLNNPQTKDSARQQFKECVNTVAVVKTENNEKFVHLKKKYRSPVHSGSSQSGDVSSPDKVASKSHDVVKKETTQSPNLNKSYEPIYDLPFADGATQQKTTTQHQTSSPKHHEKDQKRPSQDHVYDQVPHKSEIVNVENKISSPKKLPSYEEHISQPFVEEPTKVNTSGKSPTSDTTDIDAFGFNKTTSKTQNKGSLQKRTENKSEDTTSRSSSIALPSQKSQDGVYAVPNAPVRKKRDKNERKKNVPPSPSLDRHSGAVDRLKASLQNSGETGRLSKTRPTSIMQTSYTGSVEKARLSFQSKHKGGDDATSLAMSERSVDSKGEGDQDYEDERIGPIFVLDKNEKSWMIKSCQCNMLEMRKLLNLDNTLADKKDFISSALHWAAKKGDKELIQMLCDLKVDVNSRSHGGYTPLHLAAMQGHETAISLLLEKHADPTIRDHSGRQPVQYLKSMALPLQRLFGGKEITVTGSKDFAAGLRPRLDSVRKSNRLSSVISGGIESVGKLLSKSNEDLQQIPDGYTSRTGSLRSKMKKKSRKKSKEEKPTISIVSYDDFDYQGAKSISSLSISNSSPNLRKGSNQRSKDGRTRSRAETLELL